MLRREPIAFKGENMKQADENKKKPEEPADDGRTVSPMTGDWMPWNHGISRRPRKQDADPESDRASSPVEMTPSERRAMMKGAMLAFLPFLGIIAGVGLLLFLLARFWLM